MLRSFTKVTLGISFAAALALGGCKSEDRQEAATKAQTAADKAQTTANEAAATANQKAAEAKVAVNDAVDDLKVERDKFLDESSAKLNALDARIAELEAKAKVKSDKVSAEAVAELRKIRLEVNEALARARASNKDDWTTVQASFQSAFDKVEAAYQRTAAALGIQPKTEAK